MPRQVLKLPNGKFMHWSSVVDAPITYGMDRDLFIAYYIREHGTRSRPVLDRQLSTADKFGASTRETLESFISGNRAGPNETELSLDEIVELYGEAPEIETDARDLALNELIGAANHMLEEAERTGMMDSTFAEMFPDQARRDVDNRKAFKRLDRARNELRAAITQARSLTSG